jgi:phospholipase/carboxylesterase
VTDVRDRDYFHAIYFREPRGLLFEIATLSPGFAVDEDPAHLGEELRVPAMHAHLRAALERTLVPVVNPRAARRGGADGVSALAFAERPARGAAQGLLVLHHGRGADEHDLPALGDALDPQQRLHVVTPRAPLTLEGWPGHHWYVVPRVGFPDPGTFRAAHAALAAFHDDLWARTGLGPDRTVLGGFSMGSVMSYALGLDGGRPAPAGILAFSGFVPVVDGWEPSLGDRSTLRAFVAHGRHDPVMEVGFARRARELLESGGVPVEYHESGAAHHIDPAHMPAAVDWLAATLGLPATS